MRPNPRSMTRRAAWSLAAAIGPAAFVVGRLTAPIGGDDIRTEAAVLAVRSCRPCLEADVQDLTSLQTIDELDQAICPRTGDERVIWFSVRKGARIRLTGAAEPGNLKQWPALTLPDGNRVFIRRDSSGDDQFAWEPGVAGRRVTVEGCVSRTWYPTTDQRRARNAKLDWRRQQTANVLTATPSGYAYKIAVARCEFAE
jgi:hypothetical protein